MEIKTAILNQEKKLVSDFLAKFDLQYDVDVDTTLYIEDNNKIIGTISKSKHIIKCLAVDPSYQSENLASKLITKIIEILQSENIFYYQVFTKPIYENLFKSMGFQLLAKSDKIIAMEAGNPNIYTTINNLKNQIRLQYGEDIFKTKIASIVMNANPLTNGHLFLIEKASKENDLVLVFILEEEKSLFTFKERFALAYAATRLYSNVMILPSTRYIISKDTFPNYFLKEVNEHTKEYAKIDVRIFKDYFMTELSIDNRYVGSETDPLMKIYNDTLEEELGEKLIVVERLKDNEEIISASLVRKLILDNQVEESLKYLPKGTHFLIISMAYDKSR